MPRYRQRRVRTTITAAIAAAAATTLVAAPAEARIADGGGAPVPSSVRFTRSVELPAAGIAAPAAKVRLPAILKRIARCESGGDPTAVSAGGTYRGKYQFDRGTWRSMGGSGDPAQASEAEQDRRALKLYRAAGTTPWPVCGR